MQPHLLDEFIPFNIFPTFDFFFAFFKTILQFTPCLWQARNRTIVLY